MKKRGILLLVTLLILFLIWGLWFGGFKIFGTLSSLDDDGIEAFLALNFINTDDVSDDRDIRIQIVRDWIRQLEEKPYTEFVYGSATQQTANQVRSAVLRYYYGLGPVREYPPEVTIDWFAPSRIVTDPNGVLRIYPQYHPGIPWNTYFPPVKDQITFKITAKDGSLTFSRSATTGEFTECTVDNMTTLFWQDWVLTTNSPWDGEETFVEVTMFRNGIEAYRITVRIYRTDDIQTVIYAEDGNDILQYITGYVGEVVKTVKLTSD